MPRVLKIAALAALAALISATVPEALAREPVSASKPVSYADLDLSAPDGVETLLKRIDAASRKVCGRRPMTLAYGQLKSYFACRETAMHGAVARINQPSVTLAWAGEAGDAMRLAVR